MHICLYTWYTHIYTIECKYDVLFSIYMYLLFFVCDNDSILIDIDLLLIAMFSISIDYTMEMNQKVIWSFGLSKWPCRLCHNSGTKHTYPMCIICTYIYSIDVYCVYHLKSSWNPRVNFLGVCQFCRCDCQKKDLRWMDLCISSGAQCGTKNLCQHAGWRIDFTKWQRDA